MARPEAQARDKWLSAVGTLPGVLVHRCEPMANAYHVRALPDGFPDVLFAAEGRIVLVEWKAKRGTLSPAQLAYHAAMAAAGVQVLMARDPAQCCRDLAGSVGGDVGRLLVKAAESLAV
jgi:hypothetical protein